MNETMSRSWIARLVATVAFGHLLASSVSAQQTVVPSATGIAVTSLTPPSSITSALASTSSAPSALSSGTRTPKVHTVTAGAGGFKFTPQQISNVSVNDVITFEFYPPDHSVARAEYGSACVPYEYTGRNKTGFWSTTQWVNNTDQVSSVVKCGGGVLLTCLRSPTGTLQSTAQSLSSSTVLRPSHVQVNTWSA